MRLSFKRSRRAARSSHFCTYCACVRDCWSVGAEVATSHYCTSVQSVRLGQAALGRVVLQVFLWFCFCQSHICNGKYRKTRASFPRETVFVKSIEFVRGSMHMLSVTHSGLSGTCPVTDGWMIGPNPVRSSIQRRSRHRILPSDRGPGLRCSKVN